MSAASDREDSASSTILAPADEVPTEGLPVGWGAGRWGTAAYSIAIVFSLFQLWTAAYGALPSQVVRAMHVGFLLLLGFALIANLKTQSRAGRWMLWALGLAGFLTGVYNWVF